MYGSPRWRRCSIFVRLILTPHPTGGIHPFPFLTVGLLKRREFIIQLWRTKEETLHLLFCRLMACCSMRLCTWSSVLSANLASRWEKPFSDVLVFFCSRLLFASVGSASMCLRGSRIEWMSGLGFDDGAPLQFVIQ